MKERFLQTKKDWLCQFLEGFYGDYNLDLSLDAKEHIIKLKKISKSKDIKWEMLLPHISVVFSDRLARKYVEGNYKLIAEELLKDWIEINKFQKTFEKEKNKAMQFIEQAQANFENKQFEKSLEKIKKAIEIEEKYQDVYNTFTLLAEEIKEQFCNENPNV
jgi:hypothetical protein